MNKLSIVIVTWNDCAHVLRCLTSIYRYPPQDTCEVIVVDNGSLDKTVHEVRQRFPQVDLIVNTHNQGSPHAHNQGAAQAKGEYLLFLDSDTEVTLGALTTLMAFMQKHPETTVLGPQLRNTDGSIQYSVRIFPTLSILFMRLMRGDQNRLVRKYLMSDWDHRDVREVDWVLCAGLMVRHDAFKAIAGFDEGYKYIYYDDVDLCYRLRKSGHKIMYVPQAVVTHHYMRKSMKKALFNKFLYIHLYNALRFLLWKRLRVLLGSV